MSLVLCEEFGVEHVLTERELRLLERIEGRPIASAKVGELAGGGPRLHRPDLAVMSEAGPIAVEVELTPKGASRLEGLVRAWRRASWVVEVRYLCEPGATTRGVERAVQRTQAEGRVQIGEAGPRRRSARASGSLLAFGIPFVAGMALGLLLLVALRSAGLRWIWALLGAPLATCSGSSPGRPGSAARSPPPRRRGVGLYWHLKDTERGGEEAREGMRSGAATMSAWPSGNTRKGSSCAAERDGPAHGAESQRHRL